MRVRMRRYTPTCISYSADYHECRNKKYSNRIIAFDIESTSYFKYAEGWGGYQKGKNDRIEDVISLSYIQQLKVEDVTYYTRSLDECRNMFVELCEKSVGIPIVFVHNLSYEFAHLISVGTVVDVLAIDAHKPIYADIDFGEDHIIRFRCTYMLTRLSLARWGDQLKLKKAVGDLDYTILRTPLTPLTKKEFHYCERDVDVIVAGIRKELMVYKNLSDIPLTQTGKVRKRLKAHLHDHPDYYQYACKLQPVTFEEYDRYVLSFWGGYAHANYLHSDKVLKGVSSKDLTSAYPWDLASCTFPTGRLMPVADEKFLNLERYLGVVFVEMTGISCTTWNTFLSSSKFEIRGKRVVDNGRIREAEYCAGWMTTLDYDIVKQTYAGNINIVRCYASPASFLPREIIEFVLTLYSEKTTLKGIKEMEDFYMRGKEQLNSVYGMSVMRLIRDIVSYQQEDGIWNVNKPDGERVKADLAYIRSHPFKTLLPYVQGIFVPAHTRHIIWSTIIRMDEDVVYVDTDSIKHVGDHDIDFKTINDYIHQRNEKSSSHTGIPFDMYAPKDIKGRRHEIGLFEDDGEYILFKTLGAKRYAYHDKSGFHITVAGANKQKGARAIGSIYRFENGAKLDEDESGRLTSHYYTAHKPVRIKDVFGVEYECTDTCGVVLRPSTYDLSITGLYLSLLKRVKEVNHGR